MKLLLIADDFTGALDASVAFAERGMSVMCACTPGAIGEAIGSGADVVAVSTNSRELPEGQAVGSLSTALDRARSRPDWSNAILFKKVDSRLKGHIAAELRLLSAHRGAALVCPAIPRLGRLVRNGAVCGAGIEVPIPVAEKIGTIAATALDAESQEALDDAVSTIDLATLFVGASGLAEALARRMAPFPDRQAPAKLATPALFAIGSRDPVTLAQLDGFDPITAPGGILPAPPSGTEQIRMVRITDGQEPVTAQAAGRNFAAGLRSWLEHQSPATLVSCGGDSTAAILSALECTLVRVKSEILPGLPLSRMVNGMPGLSLISKSGGFGPPDTLRKVACMLSEGQP